MQICRCKTCKVRRTIRRYAKEFERTRRILGSKTTNAVAITELVAMTRKHAIDPLAEFQKSAEAFNVAARQYAEKKVSEAAAGTSSR